MKCKHCKNEMIFVDKILVDGSDYMNGYFDCQICGGKEYTEVFSFLERVENNA